MSFLEGSCIATITAVNNCKSSIVLNQTGTYQMNFPGLPLNVDPGQSVTFQVWAQQGSAYPGDDSGSIACTLMGSGQPASTLSWQGQGVTTGEGPMQALAWMLQPGSNPIQPAAGVLLNTGGNISLLSAVAGTLGSLISQMGALGPEAAAICAEGMAELLGETAAVVGPALVALGIDLLVTGSLDNVALSGATTITFQPTS